MKKLNVEPVELFATNHCVRTERDGCGELIIPGKHGLIFDYGDDHSLGIALFDNPPSEASKARTLLSLRTKALAAGLVSQQLGDCESVFLFDPQDQNHAAIALRLVGVHRLRRLSDHHREKLLVAGRATQYGAKPPALQGELEPQKRDKRLGGT